MGNWPASAPRTRILTRSYSNEVDPRVSSEINGLAPWGANPLLSARRVPRANSLREASVCVTPQAARSERLAPSIWVQGYRSQAPRQALVDDLHAVGPNHYVIFPPEGEVPEACSTGEG